LPPGSKPEDLRRLFEKYGVVTECDIMNRCGFVHMQTQDMADNAIKNLNNSLFNGANIVVERGRMKERKPNQGGPQQGGPGPQGGRMNNGGGPNRNNNNMNRGPNQGQMGGGNGGFRGNFIIFLIFYLIN
jgi:RNA recognition motif-containing protein